MTDRLQAMKDAVIDDDAGLMFIEMGDSMTTVIKDGKLKSVIIENTFAGHSKAELVAIARRMKD